MAPIVLVHGIFGFSKLGVGPLALRYFIGIENAIAARGHPILVPRLHPSASVRRRASGLKRLVQQWLTDLGRPDEKVVILAHSMGGLDARYMVSRLGMADRVEALVTIATPHRGSPHADFWIEHTLMRRIGWPVLSMLNLNFDAVNDLTRPQAVAFNRLVPDSPAVRYFSVTCACPSQRVPVALLPSYWLIYKEEGDNDCQVSVQSALWGRHLGTWPVNHYHAINHRFPRDLVGPIGSIAPYYLHLLDQLEAAGVPGLTPHPA